MIDDPIVSEVRRNRATILDSHGRNLRRYHAALQQTQAGRFAGQLVTMEPRTRVEPSDAPNDGPATSVGNSDASAEGRHR